MSRVMSKDKAVSRAKGPLQLLYEGLVKADKDIIKRNKQFREDGRKRYSIEMYLEPPTIHVDDFWLQPTPGYTWLEAYDDTTISELMAMFARRQFKTIFVTHKCRYFGALEMWSGPWPVREPSRTVEEMIHFGELKLFEEINGCHVMTGLRVIPGITY